MRKEEQAILRKKYYGYAARAGHEVRTAQIIYRISGMKKDINQRTLGLALQALDGDNPLGVISWARKTDRVDPSRVREAQRLIDEWFEQARQERDEPTLF